MFLVGMTWKPSCVEQGIPPSHKCSVQTSWDADTCSEEGKASGRDRRSCWTALALLVKDQLWQHVAHVLCFGHIRGEVLWGECLFPLVKGLPCAKHSSSLSQGWKVRHREVREYFQVPQLVGALLGSDTDQTPSPQSLSFPRSHHDPTRQCLSEKPGYRHWEPSLPNKPGCCHKREDRAFPESIMPTGCSQ